MYYKIGHSTLVRYASSSQNLTIEGNQTSMGYQFETKDGAVLNYRFPLATSPADHLLVKTFKNLDDIKPSDVIVTNVTTSKRYDGHHDPDVTAYTLELYEKITALLLDYIRYHSGDKNKASAIPEKPLNKFPETFTFDAEHNHFQFTEDMVSTLTAYLENILTTQQGG